MTVPELVPDLQERISAAIPMLRGYLRSLARSGDVEDLVQETLARSLRYRESYRDGRSLGTWLRAIGLRVFLDQHRQRGSGAAELAEPIDERAPPAGAALDAREELERALSKLSIVEREVLLRFHRDGASLEEISREMNMPHGTVKSHLHRARKRLVENESKERST